MIYVLIVLAVLAVWGYHAWAVLRAYKAGMHAGGEHVIRQMNAW